MATSASGFGPVEERLHAASDATVTCPVLIVVSTHELMAAAASFVFRVLRGCFAERRRAGST